ncbi:MAG: aminotransferase class III-fold pyridoxal phosphate-dependent enzyme [Planctomycetota bacterium]|nr:aminotransferase class III-fold pyridoxal phosphate-dependent enzyme [Planctomycetota bacterium]
MGTQTETEKPVISPAAGFGNANRFTVNDSDRELFKKELRGFVPPGAFDAHAHVYDLRHISPGTPDDAFGGSPEITISRILECTERWMGDRVIRDGLYFPFPVRDLDAPAANEFLAADLEKHPGSRGLMMIRPDDDPDMVEANLLKHSFAGFKVYHLFAAREATFLAGQEEFLPEWAWELANKHGLWITMHMVLSKALSDPRNQQYIREHCLRYPNARYVLAHAARGFNASHTADAIHTIKSLDNVYFDSSAICEAAAFESILKATGTTRLMYGSDFPISDLRGKALSIGDGFFWLYENNTQWDGWLHCSPQLVGSESLLALKQACRTLCLNDSDIERIFSHNARELLGLKEQPTGERTQQIYREAKTLIPGGTQLLSKRPEMFAPEQWPAYYEQAIGCEVTDKDGRRFIDMSYNGILACILGFADPDVNAAVIRRVHLGSMATQQTSDEVELARLLTEIHPWASKARFARTGGESMTAAVRIARTATGRDKVAFCGYHGWHDWYLAANLTENDALNGHLLPGLSPAGVPQALKGSAFTFHYNKLDELDGILAKHGSEIAAIIMEPTRSDEPKPGFLEAVRERADKYGTKLIFDEISIGWRLCVGGAHLNYGVTPDIAVFAKTISNGYAMGAIIGNEETMQAAQQSFISSAYWTEGIGPAAALAAVTKMMKVNVPVHIGKLGALVMNGWRELTEKHGVPVKIAGRPQLPSLSFEHEKAAALQTLLTVKMLDRGFLTAGSCALTFAHDERRVENYLAALDEVFGELASAIKADDIESRIGGPVKHTGFARLAD